MPTDRKVLTTYNPKPIPLRQFDWEAKYEGYDLGSPIGYGRTEEEAKADLEAEEEWRREWREDLAEVKYNPNGY